MLLLHIESSLAKPMHQRVFVHLLQMAMSVINVDVVRGLSNVIAQSFDVFHERSPWFDPIRHRELDGRNENRAEPGPPFHSGKFHGALTGPRI